MNAVALFFSYYIFPRIGCRHSIKPPPLDIGVSAAVAAAAAAAAALSAGGTTTYVQQQQQCPYPGTDDDGRRSSSKPVDGRRKDKGDSSRRPSL